MIKDPRRTAGIVLAATSVATLSIVLYFRATRGDTTAAEDTGTLDSLVTLSDFRVAASKRISPSAWAYFCAPAGDGSTAARNERILREALVLRPRVCVDVSLATTRTTLLGRPTVAPFGIAPTAFHGLAHIDGEVATAKGAAVAGIVYCLSGSSSIPISKVMAQAAAPRGRRLFQIYLRESKAENEKIVAHAKAAGAECIVLTLDRPRLGRRDALLNLNFNLPGRRLNDSNILVGGESPLSARITWADLEWLKTAAAPIPIAVKGVMDASDAVKAASLGCVAIWVSNHGGRQLDGCASTAEALPSIVRAIRASDGERDRERLRAKGGGSSIHVRTKTEVWVDGGVRRGSDVVKLLALGADFVWIGAPIIWGLAVGGEKGVERVLTLLTEEIENAIALVGVQNINDLTNQHVAWTSGEKPL